MKKPRKPVKPIEPQKPEEYLTSNCTRIDVAASSSLQDIIDDIKRKTELGEIDLSKARIDLYTSLDWCGSSFAHCNVFYYSDAKTKDPNYESKFKKYQAALNRYELKLEEYNERMKDYNKEIKIWKEQERKAAIEAARKLLIEEGEL